MRTQLSNAVALKKMSEFNDICYPLLQSNNIKYFIYSVSFKDNSRIYLCDKPAWFTAYHEELFALGASNKPSSIYTSAFMLWADFTNASIFQIAKEQFGMSYPVLMINSNPEMCEIGIFGLNEDIQNYGAYIHHNKSLLQSFLFYFKDAGRHLIREAQADRKILPKVNTLDVFSSNNFFNDENIQQWLTNNTKRYFIDTSKQYLTSKELLCIHCLAEGKTAKETAKFLKISSRTVETHLDKSRLKLNAKNKFELLHKALKVNLIKSAA